ncbi:ribosome maturation factor RimP [Acetitomaculum ruminis DSM 5522]|uniref:Ribosome maturation factor RimP n=1 Tax=Acetitomaculum ruminis DSM 5522 TaxID=1120918 RepID=A0A1I0XQY6_9FIRM|nr:ribosome maturation factor RimP [Acetitomaculum ruminis]SFB03569.1 ribosome maturation factor RimP [Acetitomaculum ruminis DSM 5522]
MSKRTDIEEKTSCLVNPLCDANNIELVDVEYVKEADNFYLRIFIDKEGGVNIDDCELISRSLEEILDREDFIDESYILEVSSPGLDRPLKKEKDYVRNLGKMIEIHTYKAIDKIKIFQGLLKEFDKDSVTIEYEDNTTQTFEKKNISLIRQYFDF